MTHTAISLAAATIARHLSPPVVVAIAIVMLGMLLVVVGMLAASRARPTSTEPEHTQPLPALDVYAGWFLND